MLLSNPAAYIDVLQLMSLVLSLTSALLAICLQWKARTCLQLSHVSNALDRGLMHIAMITITLLYPVINSILVGLAMLFSTRYKTLAIVVSIIVRLIGMGYTVSIFSPSIHSKHTSLLGAWRSQRDWTNCLSHVHSAFLT